ncbi:MAG: 16S rRNA (guanine(527)-N(7))-methyltransferase RsmG, partial [Candidatus Berkiellales bacterium]
GAGLPGIPLSILCQDKQFYLLDSSQKKQQFVALAIKSLRLMNATGVLSSAQTYQPEQKFSTILTRAFAPLTQMITMTKHLLDEDGRFLAMMGKSPENLTLPTGFSLEKVVVLKVPQENAARHLAIIRSK